MCYLHWWNEHKLYPILSYWKGYGYWFSRRWPRRKFKPAQTATVIKLRGIYSKWSQPLCFSFFKMCAVISDMGSNNLQLTKQLNIEPQRPFFFAGTEIIVYLFDTPHLLKAVRNNIRKYKLVDGQQGIVWQHIINFHNHNVGYSIGAARS